MLKSDNFRWWNEPPREVIPITAEAIKKLYEKCKGADHAVRKEEG